MAMVMATQPMVMVMGIRLMAMVMGPATATRLMAMAMEPVTAIQLTAMALARVTGTRITPSDAISMPPLLVSGIIVIGTDAGRACAGRVNNRTAKFRLEKSPFSPGNGASFYSPGEAN